MSNDIKFYSQQTIDSWDEAATIHKDINIDLLNQVNDPSYNHLNSQLNTLFDHYDVKGKSVVQVCCNNAIDLISVRNKGAGRCLGIDGSAEFLKQAKQFSNIAQHSDIEFLCRNIYELPNDVNNQFDIVFITVGVLYWMPDLSRFLSVCSGLLKSGGRLLIEEIHPIVNMYEEGEPSHLAYSYFDKTPYKDETGLDYFTYKDYKAKANYWFNHTLSDILSGALQANLKLDHFEELPDNLGNVCGDLEQLPFNPPLSMTLGFIKS
jgi:SAM-dependent methyltransferase